MTRSPAGPDARIIRPALPPAVLGTILLIAGAVLAATDWFTVIRYAVSILALITGVIVLQHRKWVWALPLVPIAILWNPVWPIGLPDPVWAGAHYVAGLVFLAVGVLVRVRETSQ
jgi:hypothetical protein